MSISKTVVISCAGVGSRLGMGKTKALLEINGKSIIRRQLEMLQDVEDVRIVIGYQFQDVIDEVLKFRKDVIFVFNHNYLETGTGHSFCSGAQFSGDYVISIDGDLLIHPNDIKIILNSDFEFVAGCEISTEDPVYLQTIVQNNRQDSVEIATAFSRKHGKYEWSGVVQLKNSNIPKNNTKIGHLFTIVKPLLPLPVIKIRAMEVDTISDYENMKRWVNCMDINNTRIHGKKVEIDYTNTKNFYENRARKDDVKYLYNRTMLQDNNPDIVLKRDKFEKDEILPILSLNDKDIILDIGCGIGRWGEPVVQAGGTYIGIDFIEDLLKLAKENLNKYTTGKFFLLKETAPNFKKALRDNNLENLKFTKVIITGLFLNLNDNDVITILKGIESVLSSNAIVYIKDTLAIGERITLKQNYSEELDCEYNAIYRTQQEYQEMFGLCFDNLKVIRAKDLYDNNYELNNRNLTKQHYYILKFNNDK